MITQQTAEPVFASELSQQLVPRRVAQAAPKVRSARPAQNWVLDPLQDALFIIAAPLIVLLLAVAIFHLRTAADAIALIIVTHVVMTVAHHLPTFIRIYGDVELFKRYRWSFLLGPVIPFAFAMSMVVYLNVHRYPIEYLLYLYLILALWDPWHFLRQNYGFTRIYDRNNAAPPRLAARMDLALCASWFVFIMLASSEWLPGILEDLYSSAHLPLVLALPTGTLHVLRELSFTIALLVSAAYMAYLVWCRRNSYSISLAKLGFVLVTFGVMYLAYTPNAWILAIAPQWSFKVGFAAVGIVHMTQYLAIVWRYNRTLAARPQRARAGMFRKLHARGGWMVAGAYVAVCLIYGDLLTLRHANEWLMGVLLALGFTSTLLHYYFDGFIWKMRHRQNSENLFEDQSGSAAAHAANHNSAAAVSWWSNAQRSSAMRIAGRQLLYFGLPMAVLTVGAVSVWNRPTLNYIEHMYRAQTLNQRGALTGAYAEARLAYAQMAEQLPLTKAMADLQPTAARQAELAFLVYNRSFYENLVMPMLDARQPDAMQTAKYRADVREAVAVLEQALAQPGPLSHLGREQLSREDGYRTLASWRRKLN